MDAGIKSFGNNINDGLVMHMTIICHGDINKVLEALKILTVCHVTLSERIEAELGLVESQGQKLLIFKSKSDCLDESK